MADQKALKKRLKVLMQRPENQICSDCPEKKPTWASLIVPPPGAPPGTEKIGAFCCLECSGSHRRLGVHISFVRSVNLDAWKEWEVRAMENGGNAKVNAIFEARLAQSGKTKPTNLADGPTRERYIRDKYERRKYYDPAGFSGDYSSSIPQASSGASSGSGEQRPGAPSEIARQRVASRQARMKPAQSNMYESQPTRSTPTTKVAQAPVSAPVVLDLLDFSADPTPAVSAPTSGNPDPFLVAPAPPQIAPTAPQGATNTNNSVSMQPVISPPQAATQQKTVSSSSAPTTLAQELMTTPTPAPKPTSNESIMALFGPPQQQQPQSGFGMQAMSGMMPVGMSNNSNMMSVGGMMPQQTNQSGQGMNAFGGAGMMNVNPSNGNGGFMANQMNGNNNMMQRQPMMMQNMMMGGGNQMMMNPQIQQQMQKQMMMMQQSNSQAQVGMAMNNAIPGNIGTNTGNGFNGMMQGMQNMQVGVGNINRQASDDAGFGAPMGGSSQQQNATNDPFSSLGGMNTFR